MEKVFYSPGSNPFPLFLQTAWEESKEPFIQGNYLNYATESSEHIDDNPDCVVLQKIPNGKVKDCVVCSNRKTSGRKRAITQCTRCWRGVHKRCFQEHVCQGYFQEHVCQGYWRGPSPSVRVVAVECISDAFRSTSAKNIDTCYGDGLQPVAYLVTIDKYCSQI